MMNDIKLTSPLYQIPLHDEELIILGRINVMWAHIDTEIDQIVCALHKISFDAFLSLMGDKMIGAKIKYIRKGAASIKDEALKESVKTMCGQLESVASDRNVVVHGSWGWLYKKEENLYYRVAISNRRSKPFSSDTLPDLHERVCAAAFNVDAVWYNLMSKGPQPQNLNRRLIFSDSPPLNIGPPPDFSR